MGKAIRKSKSLSGALAAQQGRLKAKSASQAAAEQRVKQDTAKARSIAHGKSKGGKGRERGPNIVIPFAPTDRILLIGEGAFSFAHALVCDPPELPSASYSAGPSNATSSSSSTLTFLPPANIVATALDTEEECYEKYPEAASTVKALRERGASVVFGVDATKLEKCTALKGKRFDRIVWNFPHNGSGMADMDRNILAHQMMMMDFLASCAHVLREGDIPEVIGRKKKGEDDEEEMDVQEEMQYGKTWRGTVLITLRNVPPYTLWDVPRLAKSPPNPSNMAHSPNPRYKQLRSFTFHRNIWKGYEHRMTKGERAGGTGTTGVGGEDRTWEFCLADPQ